MRPTRVLTLIALGPLVLLIPAEPVLAEAARGYQDSTGIGAGATTAGGSGTGSGQPSGGSSGGNGGGSRPTCTAVDGSVGPINYERIPDNLLVQAQKDRVLAEGGGWYWKKCGNEAANRIISTDNGGIFLPAGSPGGPPVDPAALAVDALQRTPLPTPTVTMSPPADKVIVNANVWLSIDPSQWGQRTASASAGAVTSTVVAEPERIVWDMGDGQQVTCTGPGTPYDPNQDYFSQQPDCGYIYRRSSAGYTNDAATVTATIHYHVTWSAAGAPGGGDLGSVSRTSAPISVRVNEIQSIVTGARS